MIFVGAQASNGVIVGGLAESVDAALRDAAAAGLSDDFALLWSKAMSELSDASSVEADVQRERVAAVVADAAVGGEADPVRPVSGSDDASGGGGGDCGPVDPGGEAAEGSGGTPAAGGGEREAGGELVCAVCHESVTEARAEVSRDAVGEIRCKTHVTL